MLGFFSNFSFVLNYLSLTYFRHLKKVKSHTPAPEYFVPLDRPLHIEPVLVKSGSCYLIIHQVFHIPNFSLSGKRLRIKSMIPTSFCQWEAFCAKHHTQWINSIAVLNYLQSHYFQLVPAVDMTLSGTIRFGCCYWTLQNHQYWLCQNLQIISSTSKGRWKAALLQLIPGRPINMVDMNKVLRSQQPLYSWWAINFFNLRFFFLLKDINNNCVYLIGCSLWREGG